MISDDVERDHSKTELPYCPTCGARMRERRIALQTDGRTTFEFQCLYCGHTHTEVYICQLE
jgi:hypothetical protein